MLGGLSIPADSLNISLGMGLSITLKAERGVCRWLLGGHDLVFRASTVKAGGPGFDSQLLPWVFSLSAGLY